MARCGDYITGSSQLKASCPKALGKSIIIRSMGRYFCVKSLKIETKTADVLPVLELYGRYIKNTAKSVVLK